MANLRFKTGLYKNKGNLSNGDLGFAIYAQDGDTGTLVLKFNDKLFTLMPGPGTNSTINMPLVSNGGNASPSYKTLSIEGGGTGANNAADARSNLGFTGAVTSIVSNNLTGGRVVVTDNLGKIINSDITSLELSYLLGAKKNIQNQLSELSSGKTQISFITWEEDDI